MVQQWVIVLKGVALSGLFPTPGLAFGAVRGSTNPDFMLNLNCGN